MAVKEHGSDSSVQETPAQSWGPGAASMAVSGRKHGRENARLRQGVLVECQFCSFGEGPCSASVYKAPGYCIQKVAGSGAAATAVRGGTARKSIFACACRAMLRF